MISRNSLQDKLFLQPETVSLFLQDSSSRLASISFDSKLCLYRYQQISTITKHVRKFDGTTF